MQNVRKDDLLERTSEPTGTTGVDFVSGGTDSSRPPLRDVSRTGEGNQTLAAWRESFRELSVSVLALAKSDVRLALNEIGTASKSAQRHALQMGIFGVIAAIGILPFVAFLVMGIGDLINNYWLSALIVSVLCFGIGGIFAYRAWNRIKEQDFSLMETRRMLDRQFHAIERKLAENSHRVVSPEKTRRAA